MSNRPFSRKGLRRRASSFEHTYKLAIVSGLIESVYSGTWSAVSVERRPDAMVSNKLDPVERVIRVSRLLDAVMLSRWLRAGVKEWTREEEEYSLLVQTQVEASLTTSRCYDAPRNQTHVTSHFSCTVNLERNVDKRLLRNAHRPPWLSDEEAQTPTR